MSLEIDNNYINTENQLTLNRCINNINNNVNNSNKSNDTKITFNTSINVNLDSLKLNYEDFNKEFNIELKTMESLTAKQYLLIIPITNFFKKTRNLYILYNLLKCKTVISLRLIEFFVVNYVLEDNTCYDLNRYRNNPRYLIDNLFKFTKKYDDYELDLEDDEEDEEDEEDESLGGSNNLFGSPSYNELFMIHDNYKCKLKEYNKKNFDPFCRWERVTLTYEKLNEIIDGKIITVKEKSFETTVAQLNFFKWAIESHIIDYMTENFDKINKEMLKFEEKTKSNKLKKKNIKVDNFEDTVNGNITLNPSLDVNKKTKKKEIIYCNADKKITKKQRIKKEFTKTNKSIIKYNNVKILKF